MMERLINSQQNAANDDGIQLDSFTGVALLTPTTSLRLAQIGGGTVAEFIADNLDELLLQPWDMQTCVWVGEHPHQFNGVLYEASRCRVDRVAVPGQALAFGWFWDGHDLLQICSRHVSC
ncbi:hypothetical protein D3C85_1084740 [compost metagenome]